MRVERPKKEQDPHEPTNPRTNWLLHDVDEAFGKGKAIEDICREKEISLATYHRWKQKYGGMNVQEAKQIKALENENTKSKCLLAESVPAVERDMLTDDMERKGLSRRAACRWAGYSRAVGRYQSHLPSQDEKHLEDVRKSTKTNPRYGYRRIAIVSRLGFGLCWRLCKRHRFQLAAQHARKNQKNVQTSIQTMFGPMTSCSTGLPMKPGSKP